MRPPHQGPHSRHSRRGRHRRQCVLRVLRFFGASRIVRGPVLPLSFGVRTVSLCKIKSEARRDADSASASCVIVQLLF
jgi:hypothetical protein